MKGRYVVYTVFLLGLMIMLESCQEPAAGMGKSPVYLTTEPQDVWGLYVDVYNPVLPGGVSDETFWITIASHYKDPTGATASDYATVYIYEYRVTYYRLDGNPNVPEPFMMHLNSKVEGGSTLELETVVLRSDAKLKSPLKELVFGGGEGYIQLNAVIEFFGEDLMDNKLTTKFVLYMRVSDM